MASKQEPRERGKERKRGEIRKEEEEEEESQGDILRRQSQGSTLQKQSQADILKRSSKKNSVANAVAVIWMTEALLVGNVGGMPGYG